MNVMKRLGCVMLSIVWILMMTTPLAVIAEEVTLDCAEWVTYPDKTVYCYGECVDMSGGQLRLVFSDGSEEIVAIENGTSSAWVYSAVLAERIELRHITVDCVTASPITFTLGDCALSFEVRVEEAPAAITLTVGDDRGLSMTLTHVDGRQDRMCIRHFTADRHTYYADGDVESSGYVYTDGGVFRAVFRKSNGTLTLSLGDDELTPGMFAQSNAIDDTAWYDAMMWVDRVTFSVMGYRGDTDRFDGNITAENRDDLLVLAMWIYTEYTYVLGDTSEYYELTLAAAERLMSETYHVTLDMTQSRFYRAEDNTLYIPKTAGEKQPVTTRGEPTYDGGEWCVEMNTDDDRVVVLALGDDMKLTRYAVLPLGDVSGDGAVTTADVRDILRGVVSEDAFSRTQTAVADKDRDGAVTTADARAILSTVVA